MKKSALIISGLALVAVSAAVSAAPSNLGQFVSWLTQIGNGKIVVDDAYVIVEHDNKYCIAIYRSDRGHAGDDVTPADKKCVEKSDFGKPNPPTPDKVRPQHPPKCPTSCGTQFIGSFVYEWCWKNPSEPKMGVDVYFGSSGGAHVNKYDAHSSGRPSTC